MNIVLVFLIYLGVKLLRYVASIKWSHMMLTSIRRDNMETFFRLTPAPYISYTELIKAEDKYHFELS